LQAGAGGAAFLKAEVAVASGESLFALLLPQ
jgi:hypothetical protein